MFGGDNMFQFQLCSGSSQYLIDMCNSKNWQAAKNEFKKRGYQGKYLLILTTNTSFRIYNINLK